MKPGDKVIYQYKHHLNSKSSTIITKKGEILRWTYSKKYTGRKERTDYALVQLEGNKNPSKIHVSKLILTP